MISYIEYKSVLGVATLYAPVQAGSVKEAWTLTPYEIQFKGKKYIKIKLEDQGVWDQ